MKKQDIITLFEEWELSEQINTQEIEKLKEWILENQQEIGINWHPEINSQHTPVSVAIIIMHEYLKSLRAIRKEKETYKQKEYKWELDREQKNKK